METTLEKKNPRISNVGINRTAKEHPGQHIALSCLAAQFLAAEADPAVLGLTLTGQAPQAWENLASISWRPLSSAATGGWATYPPRHHHFVILFFFNYS